MSKKITRQEMIGSWLLVRWEIAEPGMLPPGKRIVIIGVDTSPDRQESRCHAELTSDGGFRAWCESSMRYAPAVPQIVVGCMISFLHGVRT